MKVGKSVGHEVKDKISCMNLSLLCQYFKFSNFKALYILAARYSIIRRTWK